MMFWGLSWTNAKILGEYFSPLELMFWRFFFASIILSPFLYFYNLELKKIQSEFFKIVISAIFLCFYNFCYFKGTQLGYAGLGAVIVTSLMPIFTTIFTGFFYKKKINLKTKIGIFLGIFSGLIILQSWKLNIEQLIRSGNIYFIFGALSWSILTILTQNITKKISNIIYSIVLLILCSLIILFFHPQSLNIKIFESDLRFWIHFLSVTIGGLAFGTVSYFYATEKLGALRASSFSFLVPLSAILFSMVILDEIPDIISLMGCFIAVVSVILINYSNNFKKTDRQ